MTSYRVAEPKTHQFLPAQSKHVAIDGKMLRRSFDRASRKAAIHMINACVQESHAVFGQFVKGGV